MARTLAATGAVLVALALWFSFGTFEPRALGLVTAGAVAAIAAAIGAERGGTSGPRWMVATRTILWIGFAGGLATQLLFIPGDRRAPAQHPYFVSLAWVAVATALTYLLPRPPRWLDRWRFPFLLLCFAGMVAVAFRLGRLPIADPWFLREASAEALWKGRNPYELVFPNIYQHERFYGPGFLEGGKVVVFPYPPLTVLLDAPSALLLGDVRWVCVGAMALAAWLISRLGQRPVAELAGLLVLFQPRTLYVAKISWTEPVVLAAWAATLLLVRRWRSGAPAGWTAAGLAAGVLVAAKQYAPLLLLPLAFAAPRGGRWKAALAGAGLLSAITIPFVLWNPPEFWHDVAMAQLRQPFRPDALSWLAAWARWRGGTPSALVGFALAGLALLAGLRRRPSLRRAAVTAGAAFLLLVLFNKQAFCNYYWLVVGLLASASAIDEPVPEPGGEALP